MPDTTVEMVEPGCYIYDLTVQLPSVGGSEQPRTRWVADQFYLCQPMELARLQSSIVDEVCDDVDPGLVTVVNLSLTFIQAWEDTP